MNGYHLLCRADRKHDGGNVVGWCLFYPSVNRAFFSTGNFRCDDFVEVSINTIERSADGMVDKNGTRIFEGDIIKTNEGEIYEVKNRKGCWAGVRGENEWEFLVTIANQSCIIGNKRDNPELLEVSQ